MINLIPLRARKDVKVEYWIRVVSVWFFLMSFALLITGVLLFPSLSLIQSQLDVYGNSYKQASEENESNKKLEESIRVANSVAQKLVRVEDTYLFTVLLADIQAAANDTIFLESVLMNRTDGKVDTIQLTGNAVSRGALVQFRDALEAYDAFASIELPLSNLAKDKDIPFNITVTIQSQET